MCVRVLLFLVVVFSLQASSVCLLNWLIIGGWGGRVVVSLLLLCVLLNLVTSSENNENRLIRICREPGSKDCGVCECVMLILLTVSFRGMVAGLCSAVVGGLLSLCSSLPARVGGSTQLSLFLAVGVALELCVFCMGLGA